MSLMEEYRLWRTIWELKHMKPGQCIIIDYKKPIPLSKDEWI